jgi:hypothetical protein
VTASSSPVIVHQFMQPLQSLWTDFLLRSNCTLEDQPQSYIDQGRVLPFRDARLQTLTHFKTLISLGSSAPRPGAPIGNFMVSVLGHKGTMAQGTRAQLLKAQGHKGTTHYGEQSLKDQENLMVTLMVLIMIDRYTCE